MNHRTAGDVETETPDNILQRIHQGYGARAWFVFAYVYNAFKWTNCNRYTIGFGRLYQFFTIFAVLALVFYKSD